METIENSDLTQLRALPAGWRFDSIGNLFDIRQGKSLARHKQTGKQRKKFLRTANVLWGKLELAELDEMDFSPSECEDLALRSGDLLVCEGGDIGRTALWRGELADCYYQNHLHRLRAHDGRVNPFFMMFWMQAAITLLHAYGEFGNRTTIPNLSRSRLSEFVIPVPEPSEQEKIAAVLWKIQKAVEIEDAIVRNARDLKKSLLRRLFTHGLRGEPLKETEIGPVPQSWIEIQIGGLGQIVTGTTPPTANRDFYDDGKFQFIAPADLGQTTFIYKTEKKISEKGLAVSRTLPRYAVCFVCIGSSIGKVGVTVEEISATNQQINSVIVNEKYDPLCVGYLFEFKSAHIASFTSPSPVPILSKGKFEEIIIFAPQDKEEQREIANILQTVDRKIGIHESKKRSLQELFKTTLHKLMTAQIRVTDLNIDTSEVKTPSN